MQSFVGGYKLIDDDFYMSLKDIANEIEVEIEHTKRFIATNPVEIKIVDDTKYFRVSDFDVLRAQPKIMLRNDY